MGWRRQPRSPGTTVALACGDRCSATPGRQKGLTLKVMVMLALRCCVTSNKLPVPFLTLAFSDGMKGMELDNSHLHSALKFYDSQEGNATF